VKTIAHAIRFALFIVVAPILAAVTLLIFISSIGFIFSHNRRMEVTQVWRKAWHWVEDGSYQ